MESWNRIPVGGQKLADDGQEFAELRNSQANTLFVNQFGNSS